MVSIIVPVYNAQRTIRRCLISLMNQTYTDIEIVVVNDGSTDGSGAIIDEILSDVERKVIIHKANSEGAEQARLDGIAESHGQLVAFSDADDYYELNALEIMVDAMKRYEVDMVQCNADKFISLFGGFMIRIPSKSHDNAAVRVICKEEIMDRDYLSFFGCGSFSVTVWSKLYKRTLLDDLNRCGLRAVEDLWLNMQVFPKLKSICVIPNILYHYERQGTTSIYMPDYIEISKRLYQLKVEKAREMQSDKALLYSTIELRNCFKVQVESMILHKADSADGIKRWICQELQDSTYDVFGWLSKQKQSGNSALSQAIITKDSDTIYHLCRKSVYEWKWKKIARRIMISIS